MHSYFGSMRIARVKRIMHSSCHIRFINIKCRLILFVLRYYGAVRIARVGWIVYSS